MNDDLKFFVENQDELVQKYRGQFLVIKGQEVVGAYSSALKAYLEAIERYEPGSFIIQHCEPGPEAYSVSLSHARIVFADAAQ